MATKKDKIYFSKRQKGIINPDNSITVTKVISYDKIEMPEKINVPVLKLNVENKNGRVYTDDAIKTIVKQFNARNKKGLPMWGQYGMVHSTDGIKLPVLITHKLFKRKDILNAEISLTEHNKELAQLYKDGIESGKFVVRPASIGVVNEDKTVTIKQIISFNIIPKEDDAYNGII